LSTPTTLPQRLKVAQALGMTDPLGSQITLYKSTMAVVKQEYLSRLSYLGIQPNWVDLERVARETKRQAKVSLLGLFRLKVRDLALRTIEGQPAKPTKDNMAATAGDLASQIMEAFT
jgi:hypothetical protein